MAQNGTHITNRHPSAGKIQDYRREEAQNPKINHSRSTKLQIDNFAFAKQQNSPSSRGMRTESTTTASSRAGTKNFLREQDNHSNLPLQKTPDLIQKGLDRLDRKRSTQESISSLIKEFGQSNHIQQIRASQLSNFRNPSQSNFALENPRASNERERVSSIDNDLFQVPSGVGSFNAIPNDGNFIEQSKVQANKNRRESNDFRLEDFESFRPTQERPQSDLESPEIQEKSGLELDTKSVDNNVISQESSPTLPPKDESTRDEKMRRLIIDNRRLTDELNIEKNLREQQYLRLANEIEHYKQRSNGGSVDLSRNFSEGKEIHADTKRIHESNDELKRSKTKTAAMNDKLRSQIGELEKNIEMEKAQNQKYKEQISELNTQFSTQTQQLIEGLLKETAQRELVLRTDIKKREDEVEGLKKHNIELTRIRGELEEGFRAQQGEVVRLREQIREMVSQTDKIKTEYLRMDHNYKSTYANKSSEIDFLKKQLSETIKQKNIINADYEQLRTDIERIRLRNKELTTEIEVLETDRKGILQQIKDLKSKELEGARRASKVVNIATSNKDPFRMKKLSDTYAGLKQVATLLEELVGQMDRELAVKAKLIKDRLREEISQLEMEIQFIRDSMAVGDVDPNSNGLQGLGEVPLSRDKSFTLGKASIPKPNQPEKIPTKSEIKDTVTVQSIDLDREDDIAAVYKELGKLNQRK